MTGRPSRPDQRGSISPLLVGMALLLLVLVGVVVDASAAFLHRQGLDNVAEGSAMAGADAGSAAAHALGLPGDRLPQVEGAVRSAVEAHLAATGARTEHPGLSVQVSVDAAARAVRVRVSAPVDLPVPVPGATSAPVVTAQAAAVVRLER